MNGGASELKLPLDSTRRTSIHKQVKSSHRFLLHAKPRRGIAYCLGCLPWVNRTRTTSSMRQLVVAEAVERARASGPTVGHASKQSKRCTICSNEADRSICHLSFICTKPDLRVADCVCRSSLKRNSLLPVVVVEGKP